MVEGFKATFVSVAVHVAIIRVLDVSGLLLLEVDGCLDVSIGVGV